MSKYQELIENPPKIEIKENAKEVIFEVVSCMCDNRNSIQFKKNEEGEFRVNGRGSAMSNFQMAHDTIDLTWSADEQDWSRVIAMINTGTSRVASVRAR